MIYKCELCNKEEIIAKGDKPYKIIIPDNFNNNHEYSEYTVCYNCFKEEVGSLCPKLAV